MRGLIVASRKKISSSDYVKHHVFNIMLRTDFFFRGQHEIPAHHLSDLADLANLDSRLGNLKGKTSKRLAPIGRGIGGNAVFGRPLVEPPSGITPKTPPDFHHGHHGGRISPRPHKWPHFTTATQVAAFHHGHTSGRIHLQPMLFEDCYYSW